MTPYNHTYTAPLTVPAIMNAWSQAGRTDPPYKILMGGWAYGVIRDYSCDDIHTFDKGRSVWAEVNVEPWCGVPIVPSLVWRERPRDVVVVGVDGFFVTLTLKP